MTYSAQRETETLNQCDTVTRLIRELEKAISEGPRLPAAREAERDAGLAKTRAIYESLALHCRRNLYP